MCFDEALGAHYITDEDMHNMTNVSGIISFVGGVARGHFATGRWTVRSFCEHGCAEP